MTLTFGGFMTSKSVNNHSALTEFLKILGPYLNDQENTEVVVNKPGEVITKSHTGWSYHCVKSLTFGACKSIAKLTATYSQQALDKNQPIISATLPEGERIQIVIPPATLTDHISISIRKPSKAKFTLEDYQKSGAFCESIGGPLEIDETEKELLRLKEEKKYVEFLKLAVTARKNIVVSGSTGSGKTTLMRTLVEMVPKKEERLITIENVDELGLYKSHANAVPLFYSASGQGIAKGLSQQQLLESSLRMTPDRIFVAELIRGEEAFYFLRNVNSGHPGSITSIHANSAKLAIEQLVLFLNETSSGNNMSRSDIKQIIFMCVDIIIQMKEINYKRYITEIYYDPEHKRQQMV